MLTTRRGIGTIGFVGLGDMGYPMAANYARHGLDVLAYDLRPEMEAQVVAWGGKWAHNVADLIRRSDVLCVCLLDDSQVRSFVEVNGVFDSLCRSATFVMHSTISPLLMKDLADEGALRGIAVVDAPVSGSHTARETGELTVMVAADRHVFESLQPMWTAISAHAFRVADEPGSAQVVKLCNNMMAETNYLVALEALKIARSFDVSEQDFIDVVEASSGNSWMIENWGSSERHMTNHPHGGPKARFGILLKDLQTAVEIGGDVNVPPLIAAVAAVAGEHILRYRFDHITATPSNPTT